MIEMTDALALTTERPRPSAPWHGRLRYLRTGRTHLVAKGVGAMQTRAGWDWGRYICATPGRLHSSPAFQGGPGGGGDVTVHVIRFYLPGIALVAMLAAGLVSRFERLAIVAVIALLVVDSLFSSPSMTSSRLVLAAPPSPRARRIKGAQHPLPWWDD